MYKVFAFLKRNPNLTHDEYRAGHVGFHCGQSRRLKNIRGYLVNIWANEPLESKLDSAALGLSINAPPDFLEWWDGFPQVYFDNRESWVNARSLEPNRATADGLALDSDWRLDDSPHLFAPTPDDSNGFQSHHLHVFEQVVVPVVRPEHKITKIMHFVKRHQSVNDAAWRARLESDYLPALGELTGLLGCTLNLRDADQEAAMRGFFDADDWAFSAEGTAQRRRFCELWDGAIELFFDTVEAFGEARAKQRTRLQEPESSLFERSWFVEVDENLIVMPNRDPAPSFYYR